MTELALKCPPPPVGDWSAATEVTIASIAEFHAGLAATGIDASFGLELRVAYHYEHVAPPPAQRRPSSLRKFFLRPAVEPILYSYRDDLDPEIAEHALVNRFASSLTGAFSGVRVQDARSGKDEAGNFASFPECDYAGLYLERIAAALPAIADPVAKAAFVLGETILSHPYPDGNARLARCLALLTLARHLGHDSLPLPLGPVLMAHNDRYIDALQALSRNGDWQAFGDDFVFFLNEAARLALRLVR